MALPDNRLEFAYSDDGNRVKKTTVNGLQTTDETYYLNDGLSVLNELNDTGAITKSIVKGLSAQGGSPAGGEQIADIGANGVVKYLHQDALGSTALMTDANGAVIQKYEYDPFGRLVGSEGNEANKYQFTGQEYDPESELVYMNARYYNPRIGRFLSRDARLGYQTDLLSRNPYIYVKNNPLKYTDPSGGEEEDVTDDFIEKLKDNAKYMQDFSDFRDYFTTNWTVPNKKFLGKIKEKLPHLGYEDINKLKEDDIVWDDLQSTPYKFLEFYNKVKHGGAWDIKSQYPKWDSGWLSLDEMTSIVINGATEQNNQCIPLTCGNFYEKFNEYFMSEPYGYKGLGNVKIGGYVYGNDVAGNIMFGYTGTAAGFEQRTLLKMAGLAQKELDLREGRAIAETWEASYYDQPRDQSSITSGIKLWNDYNSKINSKSFDNVLSSFRESFTR